MDKEFSFENVIKIVGNANKMFYGINPYELNKEEKDKLDLERRIDLEELQRDNDLGR